ncbi:MAG: hydroxymethylglutaryl-CoA reductase, degradative [Pseudomonadota bacterium]
MTSVFSGFYRLAVSERLSALHEAGAITTADFAALSSGDVTLDRHVAEHLIENVIGVAGLPFAVALNFRINGVDRLVPMVVEEPSIVAALSSAAKIARSAGGFRVDSDPALMIGQVQLLDVADPDAALAALEAEREAILEAANDVHPNLTARGGGVRGMECHVHARTEGGHMVIVHLLIDTCDAMGANLINTICEQVAPMLARIVEGRAHLRILSNLADRALVRSTMRVPLKALDTDPARAASIRDGVIAANEFAELDPHRATTHNKGIMNGIDAVVVATGNDWRAAEASAHAYAARDGQYRSLTRWVANDEGDLVGTLELPIKLGIVGGSVRVNPVAQLSLRLAGIERARELDEIACAVGLAQNFSAIKALATDGIQRGHMALHARSVAIQAGAREQEVDAVVADMVSEGAVKTWRARELLDALRAKSPAAVPRSKIASVSSSAKIILAGEHAVVYGRRALGLPMPRALRAEIFASSESLTIDVPDWQLRFDAADDSDLRSPLGMLVETITRLLELPPAKGHIEVASRIPFAAGLGGSAALAVVLIRALARLSELTLDDETINKVAFECEKLAHGTPSGVDNTLATFAKPLVFAPAAEQRWRDLKIGKPLQLVIAFSGVKGVTSELVARVAQRRERQPGVFDQLFDQIDLQVDRCLDALATGDNRALGDALNVNQGLLNALGVSHPKLEQMLSVARDAGALGAKLTGAGGGGSVVAVCQPETANAVAEALRKARFEARVIDIPPTDAADAIVSFEGEELILVDSNDEPTGYLSKAEAHNGEGTLHRAFSLFVFNDEGELLLQQRSHDKRLWGGFWSNSCCSHPRRGETMEYAVHRRLEQELGCTAELKYLYKFEYQANFGPEGSEHELCSVYVGRLASEVRPNKTEIADWRFVSPEAVDAMLKNAPDTLTPWFKMEWERLRRDHADDIAALASPVQA